MKVLPIMIGVCLTGMLSVTGCSPDEQPQQSITRPKIVRAIKKPAPPKIEKAGTPEEKPAQKELEQTEKADEVRTSAIEEKTPVAKEPEPSPAEPEKKGEPGTYIVQSGESLSAIAGKAEIYGDPLKWPILYRLNLSRLESLKADVELPFRELPEGVVYFPTYLKRTVQPLVRFFGQEPENLYGVSQVLNARKTDFGDLAVTIDAFSQVPITIVIWKGDEEFSPEGNILFDANISDYLPTEDITILCETITWKLVRLLNNA